MFISKRGSKKMRLIALLAIIIVMISQGCAMERSVTTDVDTRPCVANYSTEGNIFTGKQFKTFQDFTNISRDIAFDELVAEIASTSTYQITNSNKNLGIISAFHPVSGRQGKTIQLNAAVKSNTSVGTRVELIFTFSDGLAVSADDVQKVLCHILSVIKETGEQKISMESSSKTDNFDINSDKVVQDRKPSNISPSTSSGSRSYTEPNTGMEFVWVEGGCYQMGDTFGDRDSDEKPVHRVCVDGFWLGKTEVTQGQWTKIMGSNPSYFQKGDNYPVNQVSWNDCQAFIKKLNSRSGKRLRLPYEAEWEYAARSGGKSEKYAGGSSVGDVAWYNPFDRPMFLPSNPVGENTPNGLGLYDMSGNVSEWCQDWYEENYYSHSPQDNPHGPSMVTVRVVRGGASCDSESGVRTSARDRNAPDFRGYFLGFRLALPSGH